MKFLMIILSGFLMVACATQYGDNSLTGGITVTEIDAVTLRIDGAGNRYTSSEAIGEHVFLRAAQETLGRGYSYFQVLDEDNDVTEESVAVAGVSTASTGTSSSVNNDGRIIFAYTLDEDNSAPGQTFTVERATTRVVIRLYLEKISDSPAANIYSAAEILAELGPKYLD